jgi:predicted nuclease with TOPRIM domain
MAGVDERNELNELQREWRREVSENLKELRGQCNAINNQLMSLKEIFAHEVDLDHLQNRVQRLENDKSKIMGAFVVLQALGGAVLWVINKFWN